MTWAHRPSFADGGNGAAQFSSTTPTRPPRRGSVSRLHSRRYACALPSTFVRYTEYDGVGQLLRAHPYHHTPELNRTCNHQTLGSLLPRCVAMLTSSSPTISAPPSPSTSFHVAAAHSHRSSYHASRRTSASSCAHTPSPRFAVSSQPARRFDTPQTPKAVPLFAPSPQGTKRSYADASTQYSPAGYPPTYHPPPHSTAHQPAPPALSAPAIVDTQRAAVAASVATATTAPPAPPEPALRVDPSTATARQPQNAQPQSRPTPRDAARGEQQRIVPTGPAQEQVPSSPAKRLRPPEANVKAMPLKYETCDVKDLGVLISDMLMELVRLNDGYPLRDGQLTRFHSRYVDLFDVWHFWSTLTPCPEHRQAYLSATICSASLCMLPCLRRYCSPWYSTSTSCALHTRLLPSAV